MTKDKEASLDLFRDLTIINSTLGEIFDFAAARDEVDFAFSLSPEFRGWQDAGWNTAEESLIAFNEGMELLSIRNPDRATLRNLLYRYLCIAEASGLYEIVANHIAIIGSDIYRLWPFQKIVVQHKPTGRVIAPNANRIFKELSGRAEQVGLIRAAKVFSEIFDDDLRNAIAHADFVMWSDGLRLRKRNGGQPVVELV